jgi:prepilin-type N-terminal cleavage/methylation domain-containing protein
MSKRGFTLIELLIVVGIIAILAAIAVPNFLEAQVRSKVARVRADMRSIATALECYCVDNNIYPCRPMCEADCGCWRGAFTTPIAYTSGGFEDPFASQDSPENRYYRSERVQSPGFSLFPLSHFRRWRDFGTSS